MTIHCIYILSRINFCLNQQSIDLEYKRIVSGSVSHVRHDRMDMLSNRNGVVSDTSEVSK